MSIVSIAIGVICTALMFGAVIWVLVLEHKGNAEPENSVRDNRQSFDKESEEDKK